MLSGKITALKIQKRNAQRVNVYLDGEYAFGLARITAAWLHLGQELSAEKVAELLSADNLEVAYNRALRLLEHRPRSEAEIRRKLAGDEFPEEAMDAVLERLRRSGLVNDEQFAKAWVENRVEFRPRSRRALAAEMRQRGLSTDTIQEALSDWAPEDEEEMAYQVALKYSRKQGDKELEWIEFKRKLGSYLARHGFNYDVIQPVLERIWQAQTESEKDSNRSI